MSEEGEVGIRDFDYGYFHGVRDVMMILLLLGQFNAKTVRSKVREIIEILDK